MVCESEGIVVVSVLLWDVGATCCKCSLTGLWFDLVCVTVSWSTLHDTKLQCSHDGLLASLLCPAVLHKCNSTIVP